MNEDWHGCYSGGWTNIIVPEAFAHPAKFSRKLIERIYEHTIDEGWLKEGDAVLDPFGGVALGAWPALRLGLNWVGVELEQKFVGLGQQNIDLWNERYAGRFSRWGRAVLLQGDSRELEAVLSGQVGGCVSSPPYAKSISQNAAANDSAARMERKANAGVDISRSVNIGGPNSVLNRSQNYGSHPANLGNMPAGSIDAAVSSPPYSTGVINTSQPTDSDRDHRLSIGRNPDSPGSHGMRTGYGSILGQLAAMPEFDGCVASPPWEQSLDRGIVGKEARVKQARNAGLSSASQVSPIDMENIGLRTQPDYGSSAGQLGQEQGITFWSAARQIVQQVYQVLQPGAVAIWVVKSFVRKKKLVDFPGQWQALCESCGFVTLHQHRAWLVEDRGSQYGLDGAMNHKRVERKSFFRRLAERKGSPRIDFEIVLCMGKRQ